VANDNVSNLGASMMNGCNSNSKQAPTSVKPIQVEKSFIYRSFSLTEYASSIKDLKQWEKTKRDGQSVFRIKEGVMSGNTQIWERVS